MGELLASRLCELLVSRLKCNIRNTGVDPIITHRFSPDSHPKSTQNYPEFEKLKGVP